jgi:hypothetical protein
MSKTISKNRNAVQDNRLAQPEGRNQFLTMKAMKSMKKNSLWFLHALHGLHGETPSVVIRAIGEIRGRNSCFYTPAMLTGDTTRFIGMTA